MRFAKVSLRCRASELQNFSWGCWGLLRLGLLGIWETYTKGAAAVVVRGRGDALREAVFVHHLLGLLALGRYMPRLCQLHLVGSRLLHLLATFLSLRFGALGVKSRSVTRAR